MRTSGRVAVVIDFILEGIRGEVRSAPFMPHRGGWHGQEGSNRSNIPPVGTTSPFGRLNRSRRPRLPVGRVRGDVAPVESDGYAAGGYTDNSFGPGSGPLLLGQEP